MPQGIISRQLAASVDGTRPTTDATALLGFSHLFGSDHAEPIIPGLCVHLALRPALLPTANALSGFIESCRSCPETT